MTNKANDIFNNYFGTSSSKASPEQAIISKPLNDIEPNVVSHRADGNIDVAGFTDKLSSLLDDTWEDGWGEFSDGSPTGNNVNNIKFPQIIFDVMERTPSEAKRGIKSRINEIRIDPNDRNYTIIMSRQWFDCDCRVLIAHNTNREAYELMSRFEVFMETYTGYFKKSGVSEIIFKGEQKYEPTDKALSDKSIKCLRYFIIFERIRVERVRTTKELLSQVEAQTQIKRG